MSIHEKEKRASNDVENTLKNSNSSSSSSDNNNNNRRSRRRRRRRRSRKTFSLFLARVKKE
jgi:hypothetical protein